MLYLISLGLYDKEDISLKAIEAIKKCNTLYLEQYTNYFNTNIKELSKFFNKKIILLNRTDLENNSGEIIRQAKNNDIGILIPGDALSATTHITLLLEAKKNKIKYKVIHGSSILTAIAETGLSLYKFGVITSIPFDNKNIETPYNMLKQNKNLHTLFLLDLKDNKFMKVKEAITYLLNIEQRKKENIFNENTLCVACAALGSNTPEIIAAEAKKFLNTKFNKIPQCLIVPGKLHFIEEEMLNFYRR